MGGLGLDLLCVSFFPVTPGNACALCRPQPLGGAARTPTPEAESRGPCGLAPPSDHVTSAVSLGLGVCGQEGVCAAQVSWTR